jgi:hypothetical protein
MGPRAGLDAVVKRKFPSLCQNSSPYINADYVALREMKLS